MLRKNIGIGTIVLVSMAIASPALAIDLRTAAQESIPKYFKLADNTMGGICIDIIKAIEDVEPRITIHGYQDFLPFKRLQNNLRSGQLDVFFGLKKTEERREIYQFLDIPLYHLNYVLAARIDDAVHIKSFDDVRSLGEQCRVLTVYGTAACQFIRNEGGIRVDEGAKSPEILLKKLVNGRGRFAFYHDLGLRSIIRKNHLEHQVKILPPQIRELPSLHRILTTSFHGNHQPCGRCAYNAEKIRTIGPDSSALLSSRRIIPTSNLPQADSHIPVDGRGIEHLWCAACVLLGIGYRF